MKRHAQTGPLGVKAIGTSNIIPYGYMPIDICQFFVVNFTSDDPISMCLALDHNNLLPPRLGNRIIPYGYMPIDICQLFVVNFTSDDSYFDVRSLASGGAAVTTAGRGP